MQDRNRQDEKHVADRFIDERILRYVDENGRRVNKKSPNARGVREHSRKWYCKFRNADGMLCEIALFRDKSASQARLNDLRRAVERRQAGLADPYEQHRMRPLVDHLADFKAFLAAQENTADHVGQLVKRAGWVCKGCGFERIDDLDATKVVMWLSEQRKSRKRFSIQTSNFYQDAIKQFAAWLQRYDRIAKSPLMTLKRLNVKTDRRHDRRSISDDEFRRLVGAAANGPTVEGLAGENRAILYIVAAWTGLRRNELRSLTPRSFDWSGPVPTVSLLAKDSKRKRRELEPLKSELASVIRTWIADNSIGPNEPLFVLDTPSGYPRKTAKMMRCDLELARGEWIDEAEDDAERATRRESSDFLCYRDSNGLFADFHANRHTFISNLANNGVPLVITQKLARHHDPKLTADTYTHVELQSKAEALQALPALPEIRRDETRADRLVAPMVAQAAAVSCHEESSDGGDGSLMRTDAQKHKPLPEQGFGRECRDMSSSDEVHPRGFEPLTFGSVD